MIRTSADQVIGFVFPIIGTIVSLSDGVEYVLRIMSLCVGLSVGIMSFIHIRRKDTMMKRHEKNNIDEGVKDK